MCFFFIKLKNLFHEIVSTLQNAFVKGRQFLDVVLVGNELVDLGRKKGVSGVLCNLDFKKACDHTN